MPTPGLAPGFPSLPLASWSPTFPGSGYRLICMGPTGKCELVLLTVKGE